ncbi:hypothetical protein VN0139_12380 [Helicobacter pylori]
MNYPNLPNSALEIKSQPEVKEITNELLKQLQNALNSNSHFSEQVMLRFILLSTTSKLP